MLRCKATDKDDPTLQPHWGRIGKQTIEDTGPLDRKRMETIDGETTAAAIDYMGRQVKANKPFFVWMNATRCSRMCVLRCLGKAACLATNMPTA